MLREGDGFGGLRRGVNINSLNNLKQQPREGEKGIHEESKNLFSEKKKTSPARKPDCSHLEKPGGGLRPGQ